ncbi:transglutaminase family protein [Streptomyces sp. NPDC060194]|uniref:transglutaminase-like domain-containing protein n=1 Tax=Streptomyces sp. NPDC060194 TaxID=3347069 RepID=UPI0036520B6D
MELIQESPDISAYLAADEAIDHRHPSVQKTVAFLRIQTSDAYTYAKAAFAFVRDTIAHSADAEHDRVTWRASDVLEQRTGICYAKSIALTAVLRASGIPTALCYQRLAHEDGFAVHGLIALRLPGHENWARQDPRGNRPGIDARFGTDRERLAFVPDPAAGEADYPTLYAAPPPVVLEALQAAGDRAELWRLLPTAL